MIKKILINGRSIPVPVPLRDLEEALGWVEETLLRSDQVITRISVNGCEIFADELGPAGFKGVPITNGSKIEVQMDSPSELSVQTLETARNLGAVIERGLKPLAVACWDFPTSQVPTESIVSVLTDLDLIDGLLAHFFELTTLDSSQLCMMVELSNLLKKSIQEMRQAQSGKNWKGLAEILLNRVEPLLVELHQESGNIQALIYSKKCDDVELSRAQASR